MKLNELVSRVRSYTRDTTGTLFSTSDVKSFINESIDRFRQIKQLENMNDLLNDSDEVNLLPKQYHYALAMYGASRCFSQDEQYFPAQSYMDEFSGLFALIELGIKEGSITITDKDGNALTDNKEFDGVKDVYFRGGGSTWLE